jgi:Domain of unknown function (DUF4214)
VSSGFGQGAGDPDANPGTAGKRYQVVPKLGRSLPHEAPPRSFRTFLGREPEPAGLLPGAAEFRRVRLDVARGFIRSPEFQTLLPNRTNRTAVTALVRRLYMEILGRTPEPPGLQDWVEYIVQTGDLEGAAVGFLTSGEFEARALTFRDYVRILYRAFLGREPDRQGLFGWELVLRERLLAVINSGFIPSPEFQGLIPEVCGG